MPRGTTVTVGFTAPVWHRLVTRDHRPTGTAVTGTASLSGTRTSLTFTPSTLLPPDTDVTVTVLRRGLPGWRHPAHPDVDVPHPGAGDSWTSRPSSGTPCPGSSRRTTVHRWSSGVVLEPSRNGLVTAIRFYKGPGNGGTHTGSLWSATGTRLADGDLHERDGLRLADGHAVDTRRRHSEAAVRRVLPRADRSLLLHAGLLHRPVDHR